MLEYKFPLSKSDEAEFIHDDNECVLKTYPDTGQGITLRTKHVPGQGQYIQAWADTNLLWQCQIAELEENVFEGHHLEPNFSNIRQVANWQFVRNSLKVLPILKCHVNLAYSVDCAQVLCWLWRELNMAELIDFMDHMNLGPKQIKSNNRLCLSFEWERKK